MFRQIIVPPVQLDLGGNPNRYTTARQIMFTAVERQVDDAGQGELECIYTGFKAFAPADRDRTATP